MEIILLVLGYIGLKFLFAWFSANPSGGGGGASASMGALDCRLVDFNLGDKGDGMPAKAVEIRGLFPVSSKTRVAAVASVVDMTTQGSSKPVLSLLDGFQEPDSNVFQNRVELGEAKPNYGFVDWVRVAVIIPDLLQPPYSGSRTLGVVIRLINLDTPPLITLGFSKPDQPGLVWTGLKRLLHTFDEKGYEEAAEHRDEARAISVKIGMSVAMADGHLHETEGATIKEWIAKAISPYTGEKRDELKALYNDALKESHAAAKRNELSLSELTSELNEIGEVACKYAAIELCFDIMAADGVADAEELKTIRRIAEALELDFDEIEKLHDQKIVGLDTQVAGQASIEDVLGIDPDWEPERIKRHLRDAFQKWNSRISTLSEGEERDNAQRMLDLIAGARKKYV